MGLYVIVGIPLAWVSFLCLSLWLSSSALLTNCQLPNNLPRYGKRTAANGMQLTFGNASGVMSPFI
jgi:hypothetical protein